MEGCGVGGNYRRTHTIPPHLLFVRGMWGIPWYFLFIKSFLTPVKRDLGQDLADRPTCCPTRPAAWCEAVPQAPPARAAVTLPVRSTFPLRPCSNHAAASLGPQGLCLSSAAGGAHLLTDPTPDRPTPSLS